VASYANRELHRDRLTKIGYDCYLFGERAQEFIEVRRLILIECGLTRVAPETVETVEWKNPVGGRYAQV
jgi:ferredoxin-like protein FixX